MSPCAGEQLACSKQEHVCVDLHAVGMSTPESRLHALAVREHAGRQLAFSACASSGVSCMSMPASLALRQCMSYCFEVRLRLHHTGFDREWGCASLAHTLECVLHGWS
jgi:hypothetical protein